ncbi:chorismate transformation enzyme, FkbO/Hyg5 family [Aureibacter tunicatorum]|uniref:Enamine deaminase RidA (YjgF/YER057c/UK114 family) n=1 Tax=Aureibacter tunicatorum TaxID=866807 RepID=A0AAE3XTW4_9BACT|nr:hypothetical protein [Aureibacter tunicatorum]MDR6241609.1 enamine deaminase RidA (YjgF/YER057c/UK114 family) [Aureibacter tunicatorum]BDD07168.1 PTS cellobiose transporter subunit IIC [Aureibacter tunicatorum]
MESTISYQVVKLDDHSQNDILNSLNIALNGFHSNSNEHVLKIVIFLDPKLENSSFKKSIIQSIHSCFQDAVPAVTIIYQKPLDAYLTLEITQVKSDISQIRFKQWKGINYAIYTNSLASYYYFGCVHSVYENDAEHSASKVFDKIHKMLLHENLDWEHVVRQWNYIENITGFANDTQNYQAFNEARYSAWKSYKWQNGYPAATGIGAGAGGIAIDLIAVKEMNNSSVISLPISNPIQIDAHKYSTNEIVCSESEPEKKHTPKFERAKALQFDNFHSIYISGTAAILGEKSEAIHSSSKQIEITIENIEKLISNENLIKAGLSKLSKGNLQLLRIYIKQTKDLETIKKRINQAYPNIPAIYTQADICRDNLLVEVEGVYHI